MTNQKTDPAALAAAAAYKAHAEAHRQHIAACAAIDAERAKLKALDPEADVSHLKYPDPPAWSDAVATTAAPAAPATE